MEQKEFQAKYNNLFDQFEEMDRELFTVLLEKTEGEAFDKVNSVIHGDGLWAFVKLHAWFSKTNEAGITNRIIAIMKPEQCKKEFEVAVAAEKWEENNRRLREEHDVDELKESYKMIRQWKFIKF